MSARNSFSCCFDRRVLWPKKPANMFRPLIFLASLAAVLGDGVLAADEDMTAEATIVSEGYYYPYAAKTPLYGALGAPYSHQSISFHQPPPPPPQPAYYYPQEVDLDSLKYLGGSGEGLYAPPKYISSHPPPSFSYPAPLIPYGGQYLDKSAFEEGQKQLKDLQYQNAQGRKGEEYQQGAQGYKQGQQALKDVKGSSGYYTGEEGAKKFNEDAKNYYGNRHYNQEGK